MPADDEPAIQECERLRLSGADFLVFAWPCFWSLEHNGEFHGHLRSRSPVCWRMSGWSCSTCEGALMHQGGKP
jgi:hypothetical protein